MPTFKNINLLICFRAIEIKSWQFGTSDTDPSTHTHMKDPEV